jgi:hypothetical protein
MTDDDALPAEHAEAERAAAQLPSRLVAAGKAAFARHNDDAELAELSFDSTAVTDAEPTGARGRPAVGGAMTFTSGAFTLELDLTAGALQGQVVPPEAGTVELQQRDGTVQTESVDDLGWFTFSAHPRSSSGS